jgi:AcrR family transcriptional regulator
MTSVSTDDDKRLEWVRPPQQDRSQKTLDRILDAAEKLIDERGFENVTVNDIVNEAKSSVGAFYARFQNKDACFHALHERFTAESLATADSSLDPARWEGASVETIVTAAVAFMVANYRERRGLRRTIVLKNATEPLFRERSRAISVHVIGKLKALFEARSEDLTHSDIEVASEMCHRILFSTLDQRTLYGDENPTDADIDDETLTRELAKAVVAYLTRTPDLSKG